MIDVNALTYGYGTPGCRATIRSEIDDFQVEEMLKVSPDGTGEHLWLHVEKRAQNTEYVARQLARWAGVQQRQVSYAGLKDRHACTRQWFSLHLPGKADPDEATLDIPETRILAKQRHSQKLRPEVLLANRFILRLRHISGAEELAQRWQQIVAGGVPNYFGPQRFGHNGGNLDMAQRMFSGERIRDRHLRGLYLSAARSWLFNRVVDVRLRQQQFATPLMGDVLQLAGSRSLLRYDGDPKLDERLKARDVLLTGPLWGEGGMQPEDAAALVEANVAADWVELADGLVKNGLKHARRPLSLFPESTRFEWLEHDALISFMLPAGAFATSVLRELAVITDQAQQEREHAYSGE